MTDANETPNPGSQAAQDQGCLCPIYDNARGLGFMGNGLGLFVYTIGCPVHDEAYIEAMTKQYEEAVSE